MWRCAELVSAGCRYSAGIVCWRANTYRHYGGAGTTAVLLGFSASRSSMVRHALHLNRILRIK